MRFAIALKGKRRFAAAAVLALAAGVLVGSAAWSGDIVLHSSGRYFQNASGQPMWLIGYYAWASVDPNSCYDTAADLEEIIVQGAPYKLNYLRISLGLNRYDDGVNPPTHTPFAYVNGKCDLDQWDQVFFDGLHYHCQLAAQNRVYVHLCLFDGVQIRGGTEYWRWPGSFWNIDNQVRDFFGDLDVNDNGTADEDGDFYRLDDFNNNVGVGYYQRLLIAKIIAETASYDNVYYEIGNEMLYASREWNYALAAYVKSLTNKAITMSGGLRPTNIDGAANHSGDTPAEVKSIVAGNVGKGFAMWVDPDGSSLEWAASDQLRQAAWYSFGEGAAAWGGFSLDLFEDQYNTTTTTYYRNLMLFIQDSGAEFWNMTPQPTCVTNPTDNSCLASPGHEYVAYIIKDRTAYVDLEDVSGSATSWLYNPKTNAWTSPKTVQGGGWVSFTRPSSTQDWVIYIHAP